MSENIDNTINDNINNSINDDKINIYEVALGMATGIGGVTARQLLAHCGTAEEIFKSTKLLKIDGIGEKTILALKNKELLRKAEKEVENAQKLNISILFYTHQKFPQRLKQIYDTPVLLYYNGNADLNAEKVISIVGTRKATDYGKQFIEVFLKDIQKYNPLVVSGLAYGIDVMTHKECLNLGIQTIGVMANGLDIVYPAIHKPIAQKMLTCGGLLCESALGVKPDAPRFPARNRIIAGMSDATIVVEAMEKGGALITAELANDYNKEVFALAGNYNAPTSAGCHKIIKENKAHLITNANDMIELLNWDIEKRDAKTYQSFQQIKISSLDISEQEIQILKLLQEKKEIHTDMLAFTLDIPNGILSMLLLNLEMKNIIETLPGKKYKITSMYHNRLAF